MICIISVIEKGHILGEKIRDELGGDLFLKSEMKDFKLNNITMDPIPTKIIKKLLLIDCTKDSPKNESLNKKGINAKNILLIIPNSCVNTLLNFNFFLSTFLLLPLFINI